MKKRYICNRAYECQVSGTSLTPPQSLGMGEDPTFTATACGHGAPHPKCWRDKHWDCDRVRMSSWYTRTGWGEKTGNDLLPGRECVEVLDETVQP